MTARHTPPSPMRAAGIARPCRAAGGGRRASGRAWLRWTGAVGKGMTAQGGDGGRGMQDEASRLELAEERQRTIAALEETARMKEKFFAV